MKRRKPYLVKLDREVIAIGKDFRVSLVEDAENRTLTLHLFTEAEELEPRPLTKFLKLGKSDIRGQVVVIQAKGRRPDVRPYRRDKGGVIFVED